eukprot:gb/GECH01012055.1/.p1 GENE.gb/GECH01012055.1/~~gb/GECH01012055.1/.p1  ORF type:complete len:213 (+),score=65.92 gb/GECH01012055.1/:1-639(+)
MNTNQHFPSQYGPSNQRTNVTSTFHHEEKEGSSLNQLNIDSQSIQLIKNIVDNYIESFKSSTSSETQKTLSTIKKNIMMEIVFQMTTMRKSTINQRLNAVQPLEHEVKRLENDNAELSDVLNKLKSDIVSVESFFSEQQLGHITEREKHLNEQLQKRRKEMDDIEQDIETERQKLDEEENDRQRQREETQDEIDRLQIAVEKLNDEIEQLIQ